VSSARPFLSVIVPAFQGMGVLPQSLRALAASDLPREGWELIVVDDASTDDTAAVAAEYADVVIRLPDRPRGPAYARNRGFEVCRGEVAVFVDADVCVHPDTLRKFADLFAADPALGAAFGSYDSRPSAAGAVSQFRNLLHYYVHHLHPGEAETFWAGCGAVRAAAFAAVGMFDEWHYSRPQIEDIELGRRLRRHGHRIVLRPEIQGMHLKHWTLRNVLVTDLTARGIPWMWLMLGEGPSAGSRVLNVSAKEKACTALTGVILLTVPLAALLREPKVLLVAAAALGVIVALSRGLYRFFLRHGGIGFALMTLVLHLLYYLVSGISVCFGWLAHMLLGEPPVAPEVAAQAEVRTRTWPPAPTPPLAGTWQGSAAGPAPLHGPQPVPSTDSAGFPPLHRLP
jgi:GT2 family glycosyltransferase